MGICYIVGAGDCAAIPTPKSDDFIIAADGGFDHLLRLGIRCDLLIGDFDSITDIPSGVEILKYPVKKDLTDMHLGYLEGVRRGYSEFWLFGGTGGRQDHTFANISLLLYIRNRGDRAMLLSDTGTAQVIKNEKIALFRDEGCHCSVFALGADALGVTITGLEYECENLTLLPEFALGVSNRFIGCDATIEVKNGALLIMTEN